MILSETGLLQNRLGFAQNINGEQRNTTLINHSLSLRKVDRTSKSGYFHKPDSPLSVVESMRNGDNLNLSSRVPSTIGSEKTNVEKIGSKAGNNSNPYFIFSKDKRELSTPENNTHTGEFGAGIRIALINPTFTTAAYNHAFYLFYKKYGETLPKVNVTSDLKLLSSKVLRTNTNLTSPAARISFRNA